MIKKRISLNTNNYSSSKNSLLKETISCNNLYNNDSLLLDIDNNTYDKEFPLIQYTIPYYNILNSSHQHIMPHKRFLNELYPHISTFNIYSHQQFTVSNKLVHE